jgi:protein-S-isoprenylcysteine O-methyltransferase Ste14
MTTWTKRLLQGAGVSFLLFVLLGIFSYFAFGDRERGTGPDTVWMVGTLLEFAVVAMLIGAGIAFLVGRVSRKTSVDVE